jgi:release factor glutamine methyltransferase
MTVVMGSVRDALGAAADALLAAGVESPRLDAELLLAEATGRERAELVADGRAEVAPDAGRLFGEMVRRRLRREPVAYILGRRGFRLIELAVDRRVLIPRPETELLVELALELGPRRLLDVGTGSGAVALAVAEELPACEVTATDTSAEALEVARGNALRLGLADRIEFHHGTLPRGCGDLVALWATKSPQPVGEKGFDLIVANLPYVAERDWPGLAPEVTKWEPPEALLAGPDGLDAYRAFTADLGRVRVSSRMAGKNANSVPTVACEVGEGQAGEVGEMLRDAGFARIETRRDLAGIERVVVGRR